MFVVIGILFGIVLLVAVLFINFSPQFGGTVSKEQKIRYAKSKNYQNEKFVNKGDVKLEMSSRNILKIMREMFKPIPNSTPKTNIEVQKINPLNIVGYKNSTRLVWFGHSTFLLQMNNKNILIDPMFGDVPAPHPLLGRKRFSKKLPIELEKFPKIDAVLLSHDHYDHLDYGSILKLKSKVKKFYTPLGVGIHLEKWGIKKEHIKELDWWDETTFDDLIFRCTPAQHFSGRGVTDRGNTLWSSWIIQSKTENIFFSGDSGYASHFKDIGEKYGPLDFAMIECGQYNELWPTIHMFPEEAAQVALDVKAKKFMAIHWGAFKLAPHSWTEPIERVSNKAKELNVTLVSPKIGEPINLNSFENTNNNWWER